MKSITIPTAGLWEPEICGKFGRVQDKTWFFYKNGQQICRISLATGKSEIFMELPKALPLPRHWRLTEKDGSVYLTCGGDYAINCQSKDILAPAPDFLEACINLKDRIDTTSPQYVCFGDYELVYKHQFSIFCNKGSSPLWKFSGRGYLYTDIGRWEEHVFFGTAEMGGYFYILNIHTGIPVLALKTMGTVCYAQRGRQCYVLRRGKPSDLVRVDLEDGSVEMVCQVPGSPTTYTAMADLGENLYFTTFDWDRKTTQPIRLYLNTLNFSEG